MNATVSLKAVAQEMDVPSDQLHAYLNKCTGELTTIGDEEIDAMERGEDIAAYPKWQQEAIQRARTVLSSADFLPLPDKFEFHEYSIMEDFCLSRDSRRVRENLCGLIHGKGAFGRFKHAIQDLGIAPEWYQFRQAALEEIAAEWLEANDIPYTRGERST